MPARVNPPVGAPVWNDLGTNDIEASKAFYRDLFGWEYLDYGEEFGHYGAFLLDGKVVAGVGPNPSPELPSWWSVYLRSEDAPATVEKALAAGGELAVPTMEIPGQGVMAFVTDPSGAAVGIWEPRGHDGFAVVAENGAPAWHELLSKDYRAAVPFYEDVFGWSVTVQGDTDEFRYCIDEVDGEQYAGVMDASGFLPAEVPSHWSVYILVEDTDAAAARAVELGGTIAMAPEDSPYGRMAVLLDSQGAQLKIIDTPDSAA
ncbi:putative glyoxalase/bleomycin resistance protein [Paraoerskovia sediminicola]|uniref:Glyoxalase/bleomycin resistance protein n=1 Tax=Paraoerskovia sediminicola TaxID=1138587 RepID=A0ABN6XA86_9CELL|nr:VOC family protein [Paraoerskovia sediminicola]BDZ41734.1 putative glyoxalase/bleomycin resistance protein [Paraoerskovia sediminicola]